MSTTVNVYEAKTHLSRLLALAEAGEEIVIARHGTPVARLSRFEVPQARVPGGLKGQIVMSEDFDSTPEDVIADFHDHPIEPA